MVDANIRPVFALVELAKYYEHKIKDYDRAAKATQKALEIAYKKNTLVGFTLKEEILELKKRLERIKCKGEKHNKLDTIKDCAYLQQKSFFHIN